MELQELHDKLLSEGCNRFYIDGIGGPQSDDVDCLGQTNGVWEVYYIERGQKSKPKFTTQDKDEAFEFYLAHILEIEHWHLITFTRSLEILNSSRQELEGAGIKTIQNDIPDYKISGDRVFRLFVINKDIFKAKKILYPIPYYDKNLV